MGFNRTLFDLFALGNKAYKGAVVTLYEVDPVTGEASDIRATIYQDQTSSATLENPYTLDSAGKFAVPAYIDKPVVAQINSTELGNQRTGTFYPNSGMWRGNWAAAVVYYPDDIVVDGAAGAGTGNWYRATAVHTSAVWATDLAAGRWVLVLDIDVISDFKEDAEAAAVAAAADRVLAQAARVAAESAETNAETAETNAEAARDAALAAQGAAETAETNAEAAEVAAEAARDAAQAAVGGVKVTTNDTTPSVLNTKLNVTAPLTKAVGSPGGNETLDLAVTIASQGEAEAGSENAKVSTPLRVFQAIANRLTNFLATVHSWTKGQYAPFVALTDAATIAWDLADGNNFEVTLGGNRTLGSPSNIATHVGQTGLIKVTEDGTGGRTLAYHADFDFNEGTTISIDTTASRVNVLAYAVLSSTSILLTLPGKGAR